VGIDHVVTELELDELELALRLEIVLQQVVFDYLRNGVLLGSPTAERYCWRFKFVGSGPRG
jgi:hypothetical protein